jgi:hypothetical protein
MLSSVIFFQFPISFSFSFQIPDNGVNHLIDRILLFRHDYNCNNILQIISSPNEITDETLVEIVLTANRKFFIFIKINHFFIKELKKRKNQTHQNRRGLKAVFALKAPTHLLSQACRGIFQSKSFLFRSVPFYKRLPKV